MNENADNVIYRTIKESNYNEYKYEYMYPEFFLNRDVKSNKVVGIVVTKNCNLNCTYCYEHGKNANDKADIDKIKRFIDMIITGQNGMHEFINPETCFSITLEFVGGEPLLEIDLIDEVIDYFIECAIKNKSPWLLHHQFFIATNGTLMNTEKVHRLIQKNPDDLRVGVTVDGCKELHDKCRVNANGEGSYDKAVEAVHILRNAGIEGSGKLTISPDNIDMLFDGIKGLIDMKYQNIYMNPVFENVWNYSHAKTYFEQLKKLADFLLDKNLENMINVTVFSEHLYCEDKDDTNPCGGNGQMLVMDYDGTFYPCSRYTSMSIDGKREAYSIGNIDDGYAINKKDKERLAYLKTIKRTTASNEKCNKCKINRGCVWCNGYNYEVNGDPGKRTTFICHMHEAAALANAYYWNMLYKKHGLEKRIVCELEKERAIQIISEKDYNLLKELERV